MIQAPGQGLGDDFDAAPEVIENEFALLHRHGAEGMMLWRSV
jgi:hypothetical protein